MTVVRAGDRWRDHRPAWSDLTAAGIFRMPAAGGHFDRHHHDCAEYWLVINGQATVWSGGHTYHVGPGDLLCTPAGDEHDILAVHSPLLGFFFEGPLPPGGRIGHLHTTPEQAAGHAVPLLPLPADFTGSHHLA
ncbi:hypothetical protein Aple_101780 [Acrocarpospora pleiomorpha]|uniref:Cupin type-2 domain-containing protein n=1 Tax=Acrocarpospora pleiomorpha TaxID=90975 RepID=A0A5M3Y6R4_9ACTN|nr:AraC family ligand binding domain-containing protein [Acrocarpospora pleiomorpha]GES27278.1 hypothetical protein Aple_101780 [Acrocarpospora pleiomorpha]